MTEHAHTNSKVQEDSKTGARLLVRRAMEEEIIHPGPDLNRRAVFGVKGDNPIAKGGIIVLSRILGPPTICL
jgi:hypothetical protein